MINKLKVSGLLLLMTMTSFSTQATVAKEWNEALLEAIRLDFARPTVHARNLYHTSAVMWDAWATYDSEALGLFFTEKNQTTDVNAARHEAISYAAYRLLSWRFSESPNVDITLPALNQTLSDLGYDLNVTTTVGNSPAAIGNRIAANMIAYGMNDGANEANGYENQYYLPVNDPLLPDFTGNPDIGDPNRWQPLALDFFIGQSGIIVGEYPDFLSPEWGTVRTFSLRQDQAVDYVRDGQLYRVYMDPGAPPYIGTASDADYKSGFAQVVEWSSYLDPNDGVMVDISPAARGNNALGTNNGSGRVMNPVTGQPYANNVVPAGDYYRVLAEFWADGPDSETPPGHWFTILNYVTDQLSNKVIDGVVVDDLEWDVKSYLALGGGMHDVAISAWGIKGWYDYIRPVSAIRYMCDQGQSSDVNQPSYNPNGIPLQSNVTEVITQASIAPGERHEHLAGNNDENVGAIAVRAWRGPEYINEPETDTAGVGWILCGDWWPYQRPSFVTPPFAGYVSGHSTYSRAAAEILTALTGSEYFPGGMGTFSAPANEFLVFEDGPSVDIELQWATYQDAADECSLSRIYGGIHPTADDIPGRLIGYQIGRQAYQHALNFFRGGAVQPVMVPVNQYVWWLFGLMWMLGLGAFAYTRNKKTANATDFTQT
ncbi:vanadium-dependent haloperoxidase [Marinicella sp. W31]|uniref:vanadium-dependent haloperoxidase n=1 Tax=Marinicella sp. W31 TaxID=3023713 RepID=UPI003756E209